MEVKKNNTMHLTLTHWHRRTAVHSRPGARRKPDSKNSITAQNTARPPCPKACTYSKRMAKLP